MNKRKLWLRWLYWLVRTVLAMSSLGERVVHHLGRQLRTIHGVFRSESLAS